MYHLLQTHGARHICAIPDGLGEILAGITREVLRHQPDNIYSFIVDHLQNQLIQRERIRTHAGFVQSITDCAILIGDMFRLDPDNNFPISEATRIAKIVERALKEYQEQGTLFEPPEMTKKRDEEFVEQVLNDLDLPPEGLDGIRRILKKALTLYKQRWERFIDDSSMVDWREFTKEAMNLYRKNLRARPSQEILHAAIKIQSTFRGYLARKQLLKQREAENPPFGKRTIQNVLPFKNIEFEMPKFPDCAAQIRKEFLDAQEMKKRDSLWSFFESEEEWARQRDMNALKGLTIDEPKVKEIQSTERGVVEESYGSDVTPYPERIESSTSAEESPVVRGELETDLERIEIDDYFDGVDLDFQDFEEITLDSSHEERLEKIEEIEDEIEEVDSFNEADRLESVEETMKNEEREGVEVIFESELSPTEEAETPGGLGFEEFEGSDVVGSESQMVI